jgi:hypothetical protein
VAKTVQLEAQHVAQIIVARCLIVVAPREGAHRRCIREIGKRQAGERAVRAGSGIEPVE